MTPVVNSERTSPDSMRQPDWRVNALPIAFVVVDAELQRHWQGTACWFYLAGGAIPVLGCNAVVAEKGQRTSCRRGVSEHQYGDYPMQAFAMADDNLAMIMQPPR